MVISNETWLVVWICSWDNKLKTDKGVVLKGFSKNAFSITSLAVKKMASLCDWPGPETGMCMGLQRECRRIKMAYINIF